MQREKFSKVCESCVNTCKEYTMYSKNDCPHYQLGTTAREYWSLIKESNLNIRKMCDKNGIRMNVLLNMLNDRQVFSYKYRKILDNYLYEKNEYLPYILEGNNGEK